MAWVNIAQDYSTGTSTNYDYCETSVNSANAQRPSGFSFSTTFNVSDKTWRELNGYYVFGDSSYGIQIYDTRASGTYGAEGYIRLWNNGSNIDNIGGGRVSFKNSSGNPYACCLYCFINEETQKGTIIVDNMNISTWANPQKFCNANTLNNSAVYNFLKHYAPVLYNWQSVPSISGKNGILQSLVQIKEETLNDGEPVSEASVTSFDSLGNINIPSVIDEQMPVDPSDVTSVTATYLIPALEDGTYEGIKLLVKKNSIPTSEEDADKVIDLSEPTSILRIDSKSVGNLDEDSHYYFVVKLIDDIGTEATSDPKDIWTSHSEGYNFDYTGEIVEWTVPKTGIYSLETWGAQGGDATDGTNSARGGYGAYAYGEVLLTQGEKLYINVGGQNGYGGGGNYTPPDPWTEVTPDANGYVLNASANANGFFDSVSNRQIVIDEGNFDNFTYDTTNNWITFGSGCDCWFDFYSYIKPEVLQNATQLDIEVEGYYDQTCSTSNSKYLVRLMLMDEDNSSASDNNIFMDNVFVRDGYTGSIGANAMRILNTSNSYVVPTDVGDTSCVVFDGGYTHWQNKEEVITYRYAISNGTITFISQHCTQGVGAGNRIRGANQNIPMALTTGHKLKIKCSTCQGFHARAYRIKVTQ